MSQSSMIDLIRPGVAEIQQSYPGLATKGDDPTAREPVINGVAFRSPAALAVEFTPRSSEPVGVRACLSRYMR